MPDTFGFLAPPAAPVIGYLTTAGYVALCRSSIPRVLSVDAFALPKGHVYRTIYRAGITIVREYVQRLRG
ncbi:hypothetical protein [Streptomyces spinosirectus]